MTLLAVTAARRACPADLASGRALLRAAGLPLAGLAEHFDGFWAIDAVDGRLAGVAGAERSGATWLVRSVVVDPGFRGQGIATALLASEELRGACPDTATLMQMEVAR